MIGATLFSGIGAPETAMPSWDWRWHAEIEKFPCAVLARRHPQSINLGDVTADDFCERARAVAVPDVIVFGSPCQDWSVAGKRLGLDGHRGNLALVALGIVAQLRPRWFVFENVPGLLSNWSGGPDCPPDAGSEIEGVENGDFATFLGTVDELGYSLAWAGLDAQYRGLAQRRDRLFAVGYLGDWRGPAAVLLEPESLCGHSPPSRETGARVAGALGTVSPNGGWRTGADEAAARQLVANPLLGKGNSSHDESQETYVTGTLPTRCDHGGTVGQDALMLAVLANTLNAHTGIKAPDYQTYVTHSLRADGFDASEDGTGRGITLVVGTLNANGKAAGSATQQDAENGMLIPIAFDTTQITSGENRCNPQPGDPCHPLPARGHAPAIAFQSKASSTQSMNPSAEVAPSIDIGKSDGIATLTRSGVRRLTPEECETLQGYERGYTAIDYRGKPAADGPRYKALGNSQPVPVMEWILSRIEKFEALGLSSIAA